MEIRSDILGLVPRSESISKVFHHGCLISAMSASRPNSGILVHRGPSDDIMIVRCLDKLLPKDFLG